MKKTRLSIIIALSGILLLPHVLSASDNKTELKGAISSDTEIGGTIEVISDIVIKKGATLTIKEGASIIFKGGTIDVYGTIMAKGTKEKPIVFAGLSKGKKKVGGIKIINAKEKQSVITYCKFNNLDTALLLNNSKALVKESSFSDNNIAIDSKQKDESLIKSNIIENAKKVGIFCKTDSKAKIVSNRIIDIKKFGIYIHRSGAVRIQDNEIKSCSTGLMIVFVGTDPEIIGNRIDSNKIGISIEKGANPVIKFNTIFNNKNGIKASKRSDPVIESNDIIGNKEGIFITYSSYPTIKKNNLIDNEYSIYLEFQSAQWEKEQGDKVERGGKKFPGGKKPGGAFSSASGSGGEFVKPKKALKDKVIASNNFWGDDILEELDGYDPNISVIYDFYDKNTFVENGKKYKLDTVDYVPWSKYKFEHKR